MNATKKVDVRFNPKGGEGTFGPASHVRHISPETGQVIAVTILNKKGKPVLRVDTSGKTTWKA